MVQSLTEITLEVLPQLVRNIFICPLTSILWCLHLSHHLGTVNESKFWDEMRLAHVVTQRLDELAHGMDAACPELV